MRNVCPSCGYNRATKVVVAVPVTAVCPFRLRPPLIISGAVASGKNAAISKLAVRLSGIPAEICEGRWLKRQAVQADLPTFRFGPTHAPLAMRPDFAAAWIQQT